VSSALVELSDVAVAAGGRTILSVPRFALAPGAVTAVLGANGAGKTTLLRVTGALVAPSTGRVRLAGRPATRALARRLTAAVLQRPLLRRGSVIANAETGLRFQRVPRPEARRRAAAWLERLGVGELAERQAHTLSAGEAQRVSLARALALEPRLLLLDEPFASLDAPTRGELLVDLGEALAATGTAGLLVTHDRHEAAALGRRLAILHAGELRQEGPTSAIWERPADPDCARILGYENLLSPALSERALRTPAGPRALRTDDCEALPAGRPAAPGQVAVDARLARAVPLGPTTRVMAEAGGERLVATAPAPAPAWLAALRPGEPLTISFDRERARPLGYRADTRR
jgi:ABC-type sulfate/molybdate transport systems ATPase subunit